MNNLKWLQKWYLKQCDGDWEHNHGIRIKTIDNPGWNLEIMLHDFSKIELEIINVERSDLDWVYCKIEDNRFIGFGGPNNLDEIIEHLRSYLKE